MQEKWAEGVDDRRASPLSAEIPLYHILNARITFNNLNGCEDGELGLEEDEERDALGSSLPSPGSDASSVSSSTSKTRPTKAQ